MELLMSRVPGEKTIPAAVEFETALRRVLTGDSAAFEQIVARYERRVLGLALRLLRTPDDAQDAAQEVFLRAFKYIHRLDPARPMEPWLVGITVNVCRDIVRQREQRQRRFAELTDEAAPADSSPSPYAGLEWEQQRVLLWRALDSLPAKERLAVILRDVEGFSTLEVAGILGSSETTVRSQISRGRLRIKERLERMTGGSS
jgi:RNA polymerase sigma-70 factor (ECF subfamily)